MDGWREAGRDGGIQGCAFVRVYVCMYVCIEDMCICVVRYRKI